MRPSIAIPRNEIIRSADLKGAAYRRFITSHASENGYFKIKNGIYASTDALAETMFDIDILVPGGIICLYSAWHYYRMTTQIPDSFYVAISRKRKVRLPSMPDLTLVYVSDSILDIGKTRQNVDGHEVFIYDKERCVCDAVKYRNKVGIDVMAEIISSYLKSPARDLSKLYNYARKLRVANILQRYFEIAL